jgi:hypothetical protein
MHALDDVLVDCGERRAMEKMTTDGSLVAPVHPWMVLYKCQCFSFLGIDLEDV